jgi:hypothetical protein
MTQVAIELTLDVFDKIAENSRTFTVLIKELKKRRITQTQLQDFGFFHTFFKINLSGDCLN